MTEPPPRKRFQIHLSTAIVLMFAAAGIIGLNVRGKYSLGERYVYGWPFHCIMLGPGSIFDYKPQYARLVLDLGVALAILIGAWLFCEWLIRRRAARKAT